MANFVFKYFDFPENAQKEVLKSMEHMELFIFSTISTKTGNLVQSLKVPALSLTVVVLDCLKFMVDFEGGTYLTLVLTDPRQEEQPQSPWSLIHNLRDLTIEYITAERVHESIRFMVNIVFKFCDLSENAQKVVLRTLNHSELFIFSTISKKTKNLVQSLKVPALSLGVGVFSDLVYEVDLDIGTSLTLVFTDPRHNKQRQSPWSLIHKLPILIIKYRTAGRLHENIICWNPRYGSRKLVSHLKSIFQFSRPSMMMFNDRELIKVEDVRDTLCDLLDQVVVNHLMSDAFAQRLLGVCISKTKQLLLTRETPLSGPISFGHVALQNFDVLAGNRIRDLDNLLLCNSSVIRTFPNRFSIEFISRFLHCWIRGSNRRLEYMFLSFLDDVEIEIDTVLKGISYRDVPKGNVRRVKHNVRENMPTVPNLRVDEVRGGVEIRNKFGIVATVHLVHREGFDALQMFVWN